MRGRGLSHTIWGMTARPHTNDCVLVHADLEGDKKTNYLMTLNDFLAEPDIRTEKWSIAVLRRAMVMSTGPLAVALPPGPLLSRLEAVGFLNISEDGDQRRARAACWPMLTTLRKLNVGAGNPRPSVVLVGDRTENGEQLPFASCGGMRVMKALRRLGHDELSIYFTNARTPTGRRRTKLMATLHHAFEEHKPEWIATSVGAYQALQAAKVPFVRVDGPMTFGTHNRGKEMIYRYAEHMRAQGVSHGPYLKKELPGYKCVDLPMLPMPYGIRNLGWYKAHGIVVDAVKVPKISGKKFEEAKRLFVTGAASLREAAEQVGVSFDKIHKLARAYDWKGDVLEYQKEITDAVRKTAIDTEARCIALARQKLWEASVNEIQGVIETQKSGKYKFTANNAKALTQTALMLAEAGFLERTEEDETNGMTLHELAKKALEVFKSEQA